MKLFLSRCRRFAYLLNESEDRVLQSEERSFVERHRDKCTACAHLHDSSLGLNMLRLCALEPQVDPSFDDRLLRRFHLSAGRASWRYWSPAVLGGAIAGLAVLAAIQMISRPQQLPIFRGNSEARQVPAHGPIFPELKTLSPDERVQ